MPADLSTIKSPVTGLPRQKAGERGSFAWTLLAFVIAFSALLFASSLLPGHALAQAPATALERTVTPSAVVHAAALPGPQAMPGNGATNSDRSLMLGFVTLVFAAMVAAATLLWRELRGALLGAPRRNL